MGRGGEHGGHTRSDSPSRKRKREQGLGVRSEPGVEEETVSDKVPGRQ